MVGFEEKTKSRNNRRENSLAAITAGCAGAELCTEPAQTPTPTLMLVFRSCGIQLRTQGTYAHMCVCTLSHGCVDPLASSYRQHVCVNRRLCGFGVPRPSLTPSVSPSLPRALQGFAPGKSNTPWSQLSCSRGVLRSLSLNPARTNQVIKEQISLLTAFSLLLAKICLLASSQACPSVFALCPCPSLPSSLIASGPAFLLFHTSH